MKLIIPIFFLLINTPTFPAVDESLIPRQVDPTEIRLRAGQRVFAIGDIQGDFESLRNLLGQIGLIEKNSGKWIGQNGDILVLVGDLVDRCTSDRKVLDFVMKLKKDAPLTGGMVIPLLGNHEFLNLEMDFRYIDRNAMSEFTSYIEDFKEGNKVNYRDHLREFLKPPFNSEIIGNTAKEGRALAFGPEGYYRKFLSKLNVVLKIDNIAFAHAGFSLEYLDFLSKKYPGIYNNPFEKINNAARFFILNQFIPSKKLKDAENIILGTPENEGSSGPFWTRFFDPNGLNIKRNCITLKNKILPHLGVGAMVLGHNTTSSIYNTCSDESLWSIDTALCSLVKEGFIRKINPKSYLQKELRKNYFLLITKTKDNRIVFSPYGVEKGEKFKPIELTDEEQYPQIKKIEEVFLETVPEIKLNARERHRQAKMEEMRKSPPRKLPNLRKLSPEEIRRLAEQQEPRKLPTLNRVELDIERTSLEIFKKLADDQE